MNFADKGGCNPSEVSIGNWVVTMLKRGNRAPRFWSLRQGRENWRSALNLDTALSKSLRAIAAGTIVIMIPAERETQVTCCATESEWHVVRPKLKFDHNSSVRFNSPAEQLQAVSRD